MVKIDNKVWQHKNQLTDETEQSLAQLCQDKLVLFFYPRANTPGCTTESNEFSARLDSFLALNCQVVGVSADSLKKQQNFKNKFDMKLSLIADTDEILCQQFGVIKEKKMYGKTFMGIERSTFLLNHEGEILAEWRKVKVPGHVDTVLMHIKDIQ
ncbi:peroxiredoxin [Marinicella litoralis]|uniref:thioredoxin-dependent peroxiredoxin n=1 Tax=Marinicella litoralis TaxID=644220 RepID=A0A4R6Y1F3_9GAMM|nr:peroxiredoxin [Marinicella litoralis]TDR22788.1 peroxiredoxin Q/BCP [Marinicella litoralis]